MDGIPVVAHLNAHGRRYGEAFTAPDDEKTWRLIGTGDWVLDDDPSAWGAPPATSTTVDVPASVPPRRSPTGTD